ncbi:MAG: glycosyltransferase family 2 protein [Pseudomonadota bacterium]
MVHTVAVIPAHNEAPTIRDIVVATRRLVDAVIVIDDGSGDGTSDALSDLDTHIIRHDRNEGKGRCLVEGLDAAFAKGADQVVTLDADGQHDPMDIPAFLARARAFPDAIVLGDRSDDFRNMPATRVLGNGLGSFFVGWACARKLRDAQCGMRLYPRQAWRAVDVPPRDVSGFLFETAVLLHAAEADIAFATLSIAARYDGYVHRPSHFRPVGDLLKIAGMVTRFLFSRRLQPRGLFVALGLTMDSRTQNQEKVETCQN